MRAKFDRDEDILMVEVSSEPIAHAEEVDGFIVQFSAEGRPVLLEILDASDFLAELSKAALTGKAGEFVDLRL